MIDQKTLISYTHVPIIWKQNIEYIIFNKVKEILFHCLFFVEKCFLLPSSVCCFWLSNKKREVSFGILCMHLFLNDFLSHNSFASLVTTAALCCCPLPGIMQQFAISEATLFGWNSMDGDSMGAGSNQGSVAHLSEVNQESITSRGKL